MNEFIIHQPPRPPTPDELVQATFGCSVGDLIQSILENRGGQFDALYIRDSASAEKENGSTHPSRPKRDV